MNKERTQTEKVLLGDIHHSYERVCNSMQKKKNKKK